ncbi:MAG: flavodoxin family protein [Deltaproteobacteria bacterium]|jgi:multimeric flavodoxin WrbA|nr:flavodoxin family protein [Deltaproteobacteria bacterium]
MSNTDVEILALHLSPRRKGSSRKLLDAFVAGGEESGATFKVFSVSELKIDGCQECGGCSDDGVCVNDSDDMGLIYQAWETTKRIVIASPIFFYDMPAQGKAILDRSQAFWARRYILGQNKDGIPGAKGFLLAVGATKGKDLFVPINLAVKYLFDSLAFPRVFSCLTYRQIETPDKLLEEQLNEVRAAGVEFGKP